MKTTPRRKRIRVRERKLGRERAVGLAWQGLDLIEIDPRQRARAYLNTLVHELLHVIFPQASERKVGRAACAMTRKLWEARFRRLER